MKAGRGRFDRWCDEGRSAADLQAHPPSPPPPPAPLPASSRQEHGGDVWRRGPRGADVCGRLLRCRLAHLRMDGCVHGGTCRHGSAAQLLLLPDHSLASSDRVSPGVWSSSPAAPPACLASPPPPHTHPPTHPWPRSCPARLRRPLAVAAGPHLRLQVHPHHRVRVGCERGVGWAGGAAPRRLACTAVGGAAHGTVPRCARQCMVL